jgi:hypothetical protein
LLAGAEAGFKAFVQRKRRALHRSPFFVFGYHVLRGEGWGLRCLVWSFFALRIEGDTQCFFGEMVDRLRA